VGLSGRMESALTHDVRGRVEHGYGYGYGPGRAGLRSAPPACAGTPGWRAPQMPCEQAHCHGIALLLCCQCGQRLKRIQNPERKPTLGTQRQGHWAESFAEDALLLCLELLLGQRVPVTQIGKSGDLVHRVRSRSGRRACEPRVLGQLR
jgi:hypothetical protein